MFTTFKRKTHMTIKKEESKPSDKVKEKRKRERNSKSICP
jgi:hypothetical protein